MSSVGSAPASNTLKVYPFTASATTSHVKVASVSVTKVITKLLGAGQATKVVKKLGSARDIPSVSQSAITYAS